MRADRGIATFKAWASSPTVYVYDNVTFAPYNSSESVLINNVCCKRRWSVAPTDPTKANRITSNPYHVFSKAAWPLGLWVCVCVCVCV